LRVVQRDSAKHFLQLHGAASRLSGDASADTESDAGANTESDTRADTGANRGDINDINDNVDDINDSTDDNIVDNITDNDTDTTNRTDNHDTNDNCNCADFRRSSAVGAIQWFDWRRRGRHCGGAVADRCVGVCRLQTPETSSCCGET
jgi:hypothetical protein